MFGRLVTIKLKVDSAEELVRINNDTIVPLLRKQKGFRDESLHIAPCGSEAIAKTTWMTKEDARSYDRLCSGEIRMALDGIERLARQLTTAMMRQSTEEAETKSN